MALPLETLVSAVRHTLETKGVLSRLRADLRLAVFSAIDEKERELGVHLASTVGDALRASPDLRLLVAIISEFCDTCGLKGTRSLLQAESGLVSSPSPQPHVLPPDRHARAYLSMPLLTSRWCRVRPHSPLHAATC